MAQLHNINPFSILLDNTHGVIQPRFDLHIENPRTYIDTTQMAEVQEAVDHSINLCSVEAYNLLVVDQAVANVHAQLDLNETENILRERLNQLVQRLNNVTKIYMHWQTQRFQELAQLYNVCINNFRAQVDADPVEFVPDFMPFSIEDLFG